MKNLLCVAFVLVACKKDGKPSLCEACTRNEDCQDSLACGFRLDRNHPDYEKLRILDAPTSVCVRLSKLTYRSEALRVPACRSKFSRARSTSFCV